MGLKEKTASISNSIQNRSLFNKYTITILAFIVWISFFDRYSLVTQYRLSQNVQQLEDKKKEHEDQLAKALVERQTINNDIEKYGREKYFFHRPGEEVILIK